MGKREQSAKEIRVVLETALERECAVDLVILTLDGKPRFTPNLLVEEIEDDNFMMSYLDDEGKPAEAIPLEISRVRGAEIRRESRD